MTQRTRLLCALATMFFIVIAVTPLVAAEETAAADTWAPTIAKIVNFAILAGALYYFLGTTVRTYLRTRSETIRKDLVDAKALRADAEKQLAAVRARLATLPAELEDLRRRGDEELAAEKVRLAETTAAERARLLDQTRREIELQSRLQRRGLMEHGVNLAMALAKQRIERNITAEDQTRLIDLYKPEVRQ